MEAFGKELASLRPALLRFAMTLTNNFDFAEDLVQDTITRVLENRNQLKNEKLCCSQVEQIMQCELICGHRKELHAESRMALGYGTPAHDVGYSLPNQQDALFLAEAYAAIDTLPRNMSRVVYRVVLEGIPISIVARELAVRVPTVRVRLSSGRTRLMYLGHGI